MQLAGTDPLSKNSTTSWITDPVSQVEKQLVYYQVPIIKSQLQYFRLIKQANKKQNQEKRNFSRIYCGNDSWTFHYLDTKYEACVI